ncbi:MAG: DUF885 domain-containing protein [Bryobacteraceae bacterium]
MRQWTAGVLAILFSVFLVSCSGEKAVPAAEPIASEAFRTFVDDYFKALFEFSPTTATANGFHEYDARLEDYSAGAFQSRVATLRSLGTRLDGLRREKLTADEVIDASILDGQIKTELQDIQVIESWRRSPKAYIELPAGAIDLLIKRDFAPGPERLRSVISRLQQVPKVMEELRVNMTVPPREFTQIAIEEGSGSIGFFRDTLAAWAKDAAGSDTGLLKEFETANQGAVKAYQGAVTYLKTDLLPKSKGTYAIGAKNFTDKLLWEEMVDLPIDRVLAIGEANLEKDHQDFVETARKIDPNKTPAQVMKLISKDHPTAATLIDSAKNTIESIRQYIVDKKIITIPSEVRPTIMETPPYARSGSFASMDTPGAYEKKAKEAFYYITPPEKNWSAKEIEEHLRLFNKPVMDIITIHEAYPGHFVQFLYAAKFPTKTRKLLYCSSNVEGWAHYSEQMMLEQGFGGGDPKIRLAQLSEALLRDVRYVVGIKLHTQGMTVEQGQDMFVTKGFQEPKVAYGEARRGAFNPTYLYYTLGKLEILKLREDYKKAKGSAFSLEGFHNDFVKQGGVPIKVIRQIMLPGDSGTIL